MNFRKFISANSYIIGTAIIGIGFALMIINAIAAGSFDRTMVYFFMTLSGIIFWGIGYKLNPNRGFTIAPIEVDEDEEKKDEEKSGEADSEKKEDTREPDKKITDEKSAEPETEPDSEQESEPKSEDTESKE